MEQSQATSALPFSDRMQALQPQYTANCCLTKAGGQVGLEELRGKKEQEKGAEMRREEGWKGGGGLKYSWANINNYYMTHPTSAAADGSGLNWGGPWAELSKSPISKEARKHAVMSEGDSNWLTHSERRCETLTNDLRLAGYIFFIIIFLHDLIANFCVSSSNVQYNSMY